MKEYQLLYKYDGEASSIVYHFYQALSQKELSMLDMEAVEVKMAAVISYTKIKRKFDVLKDKTFGELSYDKSGFNFDGHTFDSLEEVEKALANRAFL